MTPSFITQLFSGLILLFALYYLYVNFDEYKSDNYKILIILLGFSIAVSLHGIQHLYQEVYYHYNPLQSLNNYYRDRECNKCRRKPCMCSL